MGRQGNAADDLQQRRLARAIAPDDAYTFAPAHFKTDVPQHPMGMIKLLPMPEKSLHELIVAPQIKLKCLAEMLATDDNVR
jgi:hypothetical protein